MTGPASSFNVGTAAGAVVGRQNVAAYGVRDVTWAGDLVVTVALAVTAYALRTAVRRAHAPAAVPGLAFRRIRPATTPAPKDLVCYTTALLIGDRLRRGRPGTQPGVLR